MLAAGAILVVAAAVARKQVTDHRLAAIGSSRPTEQANGDQRADEQQLARLYNATLALPNDKQRQWNLVEFYIKHNILNKAAVHLALIIQLDPNDLAAQLKLADVSFTAKAYPTAELYYRQVAKKDPGNIQAWQGLACTLAQERRGYEAVQVAEHAVGLDPANAKSRLANATALVSYALEFPDPMAHADFLEKALPMLIGLTKEMPDSGEVFYEYGWALIGLQHREDAIPQLERAVKLMPDDGDAARTLARTYKSLNRNVDALKTIQDLDARDPNDPATNDMLGELLLDSNEPGAAAKAVEACKKAAAGSPGDESIVERLGEACEKANDITGARNAYEQAAKINPNRSFAFDRLAPLYTRLGEPKLAKQASLSGEQAAAKEQQLKRSQELSASHPKDVNLHLILANRMRAMKMDAQTRDEYYQVLKLDPGNKQVPKEFMKAATPR
jgi:tetratricopeptide (TPR) repeat protein